MRIVFRYGDGPAPGSEQLEPGEAVWDDTKRRLGIGIGGQTPQWYPGFDADGHLRMNASQLLGADDKPGFVEWTDNGITLRRSASKILAAVGVNSAVNFVAVSNAIATEAPILQADGTDTNVGLGLKTKGNGELHVSTSGGVQFAVGHTASAVNYVRLTGGASGSAVVVQAVGESASIDLKLVPKSGYVQFGGYTPASGLTVTGYIAVKDSDGTVRKLAIVD